MKLSNLIKGISIEDVVGDLNLEIKGIAFDSRKVQTAFLFVAMKGTLADGHEYIQTAIEKGATAILCEDIPEEKVKNVTYLKVKDTAYSLGLLAGNNYDHPSENMMLVGVTGTNGKTTIATVLYELFRSFGFKTGLISTVCNYVDGEVFPTTHTTPDALEINGLLSVMQERGVSYVFMEVSSHAVVQHRINGLTFAGGIFINLTRDHLDYHHTFDAYLKAKKMFFDNYLTKESFALTNIDDKNGLVMLQNTKAKKYTYSARSIADFKVKVIETGFDGMLLEINGKELAVPFIGKFNALNLVAVAGTSVLLGADMDKTLICLSAIKPVSGRFEAVRSTDGVTAIIDYAHTPDALINVLDTINQIRENFNSERELITVVGCGGNRDNGKRPIMAKEAGLRSNKLILTSDNPRNENPAEIIKDMESGLAADEKRKTLIIEDRKQAIRAAVMSAKKGDVILIAGKGHENYQEIKGVRHHFDDKEIVLEYFRELRSF